MTYQTIRGEMENNMFTREQMKERAVRNLKELNCFPAYKEKFRRSNVVTMYEGYGGYYVDETQNSELLPIIEDIEKQYNGMIYAVIHNIMEFGDCYTFLWQTSYEEDDAYSVQTEGNVHYTFAYVYNKDCPDWSEFGTVGIISRFGGLIRVS